MNIKLPAEVKYIIDTLEANGCEAYIVGGCVRDCLLYKEPLDWDICTPSAPKRTGQIFARHHIIETGLKHGTITLVLNQKPFEITTYRTDGMYSDNRHPDTVEFVTDLREDLSRRDFTINALAYSPERGIIDYFAGLADLHNRIIRCVGNPDKRFTEDALRIMRALRFASVLDFTIEEDTSASIIRNRALLRNISVERIAGELNKLILGVKAGAILFDYASVLAEIIPEINNITGYAQNNPHHYLDVWQHTIKALTNAPRDTTLRLALLFHDMGKPACYTQTDGRGHFYGHAQISSAIAEDTLLRLKYDNDTIDTVTQLVAYQDVDIKPVCRQVKRWLNRLGEHRLRQLAEVKRADALAQAKQYRRERLAALDGLVSLIDEIIEQQQCFSLQDLAVNGRDLLAIGIEEGTGLGMVLNRLLALVIDEQIENTKTALLEAAKGFGCS